MCVVLQHHLAKGGFRRRPLLDTPAVWRFPASGVFCRSRLAGARAIATCGRCIANQGEPSCSPDTPMTKGDCRSPLEPIAQGGAFALPLHPHDQPSRGLDAANVVAVGSRPGEISALPGPHRVEGAALGDPSWQRVPGCLSGSMLFEVPLLDQAPEMLF